MIHNSDLEYIKTVNTMTGQVVTGCHGDGGLGNTAMDICILKNSLNLTMDFTF